MRVDPALVSMLWGQATAKRLVTDRLALRFGAGNSSTPVPPHALPLLSAPWESGAGLTVELWLHGHSAAVANQSLVALGSADQGMALRVAGSGPSGGVTLQVSDGTRAVSVTTDTTCGRALVASGSHHIAVVLDAGPLIALFVVDGVLCDGGADAWRGWAWLPRRLGDVSGGARALFIGQGYGAT
jgi:hypothetical protein